MAYAISSIPPNTFIQSHRTFRDDDHVWRLSLFFHVPAQPSIANLAYHGPKPTVADAFLGLYHCCGFLLRLGVRDGGTCSTALPVFGQLEDRGGVPRPLPATAFSNLLLSLGGQYATFTIFVLTCAHSMR